VGALISAGSGQPLPVRIIQVTQMWSCTNAPAFSGDCRIRVWDLSNGAASSEARPVMTLGGHKCGLHNLYSTPRCHCTVLFASLWSYVQLICFPSSPISLKTCLKLHRGVVFCVAACEQSPCFVTGGADGTVHSLPLASSIRSSKMPWLAYLLFASLV
jgi:WD40 repeat protein